MKEQESQLDESIHYIANRFIQGIMDGGWLLTSNQQVRLSEHFKFHFKKEYSQLQSTAPTDDHMTICEIIDEYYKLEFSVIKEHQPEVYDLLMRVISSYEEQFNPLTK